jgi:putative intracellular protease/amidase
VKSSLRLKVPLLVALFLFVASIAVADTVAAAGVRYVCPPCSTPCDTMVFTAPGVCPTCGMTLVEASAHAADAALSPKRVGILVFEGVEILDYTGPYEMFGAAGCDVYTIAATKDPVTTSMGMTVLPKYSFADAPQPDVLVVPGGGVNAASHSDPTLRYIRDATARARYTMSVCNGAFILANAGLLDGLSATTTYHNIPKLASQYPRIKVVQDQRYVDNGKIITAAGLSAGMDGALHVIARLFGTGYAEQVALGEEYDWKPSGGFVRAALADHQLPAVEMDDLGKWETVRTEGDRNRWDIVLNGHSDLTTPVLMGRIEGALAKGKWIKTGSGIESGESRTSTWRFTGSDGKPWKGTLKLSSAQGTSRERTAQLSIVRAG